MQRLEQEWWLLFIVGDGPMSDEGGRVYHRTPLGAQVHMVRIGLDYGGFGENPGVSTVVKCPSAQD